MNQITCPHCGDTYPDFDVAHVCSKGPYAVKLKPNMNERIDQLWGQALDAAVPETYTQLSHSQVLKIKQVFAKLIVRECSNFLKDTLDDHFAAEQLEEHFGVEE